jgi:N utilization substance protein B
MSRRAAREAALKVLFQVDVGKSDPQQACEQIIDSQVLDEEEGAFCQELVEGVLTNIEAIDQRIIDYAPDWHLDRLANIDRNILRLGIFEIEHSGGNTPASVAANEAVIMAKRYGDAESSRFINGILGSVIRRRGIDG